jgi:hypothetical protein
LNLLEALELTRKPAADDARPLRVFLACGFTPLHLQIFLGAHLREFFPEARIEIKTGLYGDLVGSLERLHASGLDALVAVVEWSDLDSRLVAGNYFLRASPAFATRTRFNDCRRFFAGGCFLANASSTSAFLYSLILGQRRKS